MVRYSDELIEEVRNSNDIVDIISQYVVLKRSGRNFFGLCPFHKEKSPSFSVSPDKQIFHCFGCGAGGNVIHFVQKIENIDFRETMEMLAERANIQLPTIENSMEDKIQLLKKKVYEINEKAAIFYHENLYKETSIQAQEYIKKRKLDNKTLKSFQIGYSGNYNELYMYLKQEGYTDEEILASTLVVKNDNGTYIDRFRKRLMIPIFDVRNRAIAFGGRVLDDSLPKYINSPESIVYSKGRNLFALNIAKNSNSQKLIMVEGYMDAISLYQRGINNVVASLGTALTEAQGRLLRKYSEKVIISYDSDGAGQAATLRGLEILKAIGCDVRILQMEGAKDPDEYVIKYGSGRFNLLVENAISLVEFRVKVLKNQLDITNTNDKIKFLNEISKILTSVDSDIEKEVYIDKISSEYNISKEAIYAQINKINYSQNQGSKILERNFHVKRQEKNELDVQTLVKRENMIISLLINVGKDVYIQIKDVIKPEDFKKEENRKIATKMYEEYKNGNSNINNILDLFKNDETIINYITGIMATDYGITDVNKSIKDIIHIYEKEKLTNRKNQIMKKLDEKDLNSQDKSNLEKELSNVIIELARIK